MKEIKEIEKPKTFEEFNSWTKSKKNSYIKQLNSMHISSDEKYTIENIHTHNFSENYRISNMSVMELLIELDLI